MMLRWMSFTLMTLVSVSLWVVFGNQRHLSHTVTQQKTVDGYIIEAHYTQFDPQGLVHSRLYTPKMTHFAQDKTSYFDRPEVIGFSNQRIPWTVNAPQGKVIDDGVEINFWGGVKVHQAPELNFPETTILTTSVTIFPHRSFAETDQEVTIIRPDTFIQANGMEVYFKEGIFKLLSAVRGTYVPPPSPGNKA